MPVEDRPVSLTSYPQKRPCGECSSQGRYLSAETAEVFDDVEGPTVGVVEVSGLIERGAGQPQRAA